MLHSTAGGAGESQLQGREFGFLHVKAVDDAGHDGRVDLKLSYLGVVDTMIGQLVRRLWEAESQGCGQRFSLVVTGDHSTPVEFGDHSHEPVPFAVAHLRDVVAALGGDETVLAIPLGPIAHPIEGGGERSNGGGGASHPALMVAGAAAAVAVAVAGDAVAEFSEAAAAEGALGRFPGSQVMSVIKDFAGVAEPGGAGGGGGHPPEEGPAANGAAAREL